MANDAPTRNGQGSQQPSESGRLNNLQRIAQRKQQVRSFPLSKKLEKLAVYSSCKVPDALSYMYPNCNIVTSVDLYYLFP